MKSKKKDIEEDLMKLNEYIEELEEKKKELEQENLQKRMLISELKVMNDEK
jgi:hypothetical protein